MIINVRLLGFFQMMLGKMFLEIVLPEKATLETLWNYLEENYSQLQTEDLKKIAGASVNGVYRAPQNWSQTVLYEGDQVDLLTQMGGG